MIVKVLCKKENETDIENTSYVYYTEEGLKKELRRMNTSKDGVINILSYRNNIQEEWRPFDVDNIPEDYGNFTTLKHHSEMNMFFNEDDLYIISEIKVHE